MTVKPLERRQLFTMKRDSLEKRVIAYYEETHHAQNVLEYALAILVRNSVTLDGLSWMFTEIIREIFFTAPSAEPFRHFLPYFRSYFKEDEWETLVLRLFNNRKHYRQFAKSAEATLSYLVIDAAEKDPGDPRFAYTLHSIFRTSAGRKHTWVIKNADPNTSEEALENLMTFLTTLTIFESNGVNRLAEFVTGNTYSIKQLRQFGETKEEEAEKKAAKKAAAKKETAGTAPKKAKKAKNAPDVKKVMGEEDTYEEFRKTLKAERAAALLPLETDTSPTTASKPLPSFTDTAGPVAPENKLDLPVSEDQTFFDRLWQRLKL